MTVKERSRRPSPAPESHEVRIEAPPRSNPYEGFDLVRSSLVAAFAAVTQAVKPTLNQAISWIAEQEDPRWDNVYTALERSNAHFNDLYESLGSVLGFLNPKNIESEVE